MTRNAMAVGSLAALCASGVCMAAELTLVKDGKPASSIVIGKPATKAAQFAAHEVRWHVERMTGATLPIVTADQKSEGVRILVGESEATKALGLKGDSLKPQEYLIRALPDTLILMGSDKPDTGTLDYDYLANPGAVGSWPSLYDQTGTMYAVYDFLRDTCGVKWLNPTDFGTIIPASPNLRVNVKDVDRRPFMLYRAAADNNAERYQIGGGLWRNGSPGAEKFDARAYGAIQAKFDKPEQRVSAKRAQNRLFLYRTKAGGEQSHCNHSFYCFYERFLDKDSKNFEGSHPEYFAKGYEGDKPPQLCYGCDATVAQTVKDARDYFDNGGYRKTMSNVGAPGYQWGERFFALEPMDNSAFCKGEECVHLFEPARTADSSQHSTYWFTFVNKVATELKKTHPDKMISTLAYMTHEGLPTGFKLEDNVAVHFCISGNRMPYSPLLQKQIDRLEQWRKAEPNVPMYLWLYNCFPLEIADNGLFHCFPGYFAREAKRQYDLFKRLDVKGIFHCGFNGEVDNYIGLRLMDNPDLPVETLLADYFSQYGAAGKPLREFYELVEKRFCDSGLYPQNPDGSAYDGHQRVDIAWNLLGDTATMATLQKLMDEAKRLAKTDEEKVRVQLWDDAVWSYMKAGKAQYDERMGSPVPEVTAPRVADAAGDPDKADWSKAASIGDKWYKRGGAEPASLKLGGRICHDGKHLYLELVDHSDSKKLTVSPQIACYDDFEFVIARQKAQPYRQYLVGPTAMTCALSYGEVNWRQGVKAEEYTDASFGLKAKSDTSQGTWVLRLALPLDKMSDKPLAPVDIFYLNIMRVSSPQLSGQPQYGIDTWVSHTTVKAVDRIGKVTLAK